MVDWYRLPRVRVEPDRHLVATQHGAEFAFVTADANP